MTLPHRHDPLRRKAVWGPKRTVVALAMVAFGLSPNAVAAKGASNPHPTKAKAGAPNSFVKHYKLDDEVSKRKNADPRGTSSVIVELVRGASLPPQFKKFARGGKLEIINGQVLELPNGIIKQLEASPEIFRVHHNRPIGKHNYRTTVTIGSRTVNTSLGYTGAGVGVAVVDSGIAAWHDDLTQSAGATIYPFGNQRVAAFVDFVNGRAVPYDDNGHGSHVAGIIAGNGYDSKGEKSGVAPRASLVSLKVLDQNGYGTIANIISAFNWVVANHKKYNIRVVNLSVGARVLESYWTDPLTLAAKAVVDQGVVVVTAAGNFGKNSLGHLQYGGITAPANAPWVLTVGASSTVGTLTRNDDVMASYSSSGPTYIDFAAKPDLVAPGTGTASLAVPGSTFYSTKAPYLVVGKPLLDVKPYLTLSGTSMAAPVVTGTVALMVQANPALTPNLVKAILQYTAQQYPGYNALRQGAGFLNALGAVRLAVFYRNNTVGSKMPTQKVWSKQLIWGNQRLSGGYINPRANAWSTEVVWGSPRGLADDNVIWGTLCPSDCDNITWGTNDANGDNTVWGTNPGVDNIVWGTEVSGDSVLWRSDDNIVWGTDCGGADCDNVIWGTADSDDIVWGTAEALDNIVWGTNLIDNIVWGTSSEDDVTWGSASEDEVLYPDDEALQPLPDIATEFGDLSLEPVQEPVAEPTTLSVPVIDGGI